nr:anthocyanidin 3-O-glucosyltransferase 5-like [Ipomoea batatas]
MGSSQLHVALLSSPGMGHLIPVLVLGDHLATHHNVKVTVLAITTSAETQFLKSHQESNSNSPIDIVPVPAGDVSGLIDEKTKVFTQLRITVREALPSVRSSIAAMDRRPDALIVDIFCTQALPIAEELGIPRYAYHPTTAWTAALAMYFQVFDKTIEGEFVDRLEPLRIPGCMPVRPEDMVDPLMDRDDQQYREYVNLGIEYTRFDGLLINTWEELEPNTVKALRENEELRATDNGSRRRFRASGPACRAHGPPPDALIVTCFCTQALVTIAPGGIGDSEVVEEKRLRARMRGKAARGILKWLDRQPVESGLYVSFGSGGILDGGNKDGGVGLGVKEEIARQRFVWVVRCRPALCSRRQLPRPPNFKRL